MHATENPAQRGRVVREAVFQDAAAAMSFARDFLSAAVTRRAPDGRPGSVNGPFPHHLFEEIANKNAGKLYYSTRGRETKAYHYQRIIYPQDREYLANRDPAAQVIIEKLAQDTWWRLPAAHETRIDDFFDLLTSLGFNEVATSADMEMRETGGALLYIDAAGDPSKPLQPGDQWFGFDYLCLDEIVEESIVKDTAGDPLLRHHGIHSLQLQPEDGQTEGMVIHGSRLIRFRQDRRTKDIRGRSVLDVNYDDIWNLRDVIFGQKEAQLQGDPIVVSVDLEAEYKAGPEAIAAISAEMAQVEIGHKQSFAPVEGLILERLGAIKLDDPSAIIKTLYSRICNGMNNEIPVNMLIASSRGSEQVTDQDRMDYATNLMMRGERFARPVLNQLLLVAQTCGLVPRRALIPRDIDWPEPRAYNSRERAYVLNTEAMAIQNAGKSGYKPRDRFLTRFEKRVDGILPTQPTHPADAQLQRDVAEIQGKNKNKGSAPGGT